MMLIIMMTKCHCLHYILFSLFSFRHCIPLPMDVLFLFTATGCLACLFVDDEFDGLEHFAKAVLRRLHFFDGKFHSNGKQADRHRDVCEEAIGSQTNCATYVFVHLHCHRFDLIE